MKYLLYMWTTPDDSGIGVCPFRHIEDGRGKSYQMMGTFRSLCELIYLLMCKFPGKYPTREQAVEDAIVLWDSLYCRY